MDHDNGLTYNLTCCLGYIMDNDKVFPTISHVAWITLWIMTRSYLQFNMLFGLHYGPVIGDECYHRLVRSYLS
jgi:hypothetical protein